MHTHMQNTEAVVLYDCEKQQDDQLSLKMGDIITDVRQVCVVSELLLHQDYHVQYSYAVHDRRLHATHHMQQVTAAV